MWIHNEDFYIIGGIIFRHVKGDRYISGALIITKTDP
jgi:hypothetical protein